MKSKYYNRRYFLIVSILLVLIMLIGYSPTVNADEPTNNLDNTSIIEYDFNGANIKEKTFSVRNYPFLSSGRTQLLQFSEWCYSTNSDTDYALYVYVYNPKNLRFDNIEENNTITMKTFGTDSTADIKNYSDDGNFYTYSLKFCNYSNEPGCSGLFYKYKVIFTEDNTLGSKGAVRGSFNGKAVRNYMISEFDLSVGGVIKNYPVLSTYMYQGYVKGYGSDTSTLTSSVGDFHNYLQLNVKSTYYRPEHGNDDSVEQLTRDSLHSVYFSIDNNLLEEYGDITGATATYYPATLTPALVTNNYDVYKELDKYLGQDVTKLVNKPKYGFYYGCIFVPNLNPLDFSVGNDFTFSYNLNFSDTLLSKYYYSYPINNLNLLFFKNADSKEELIITSSEVENRLRELTKYYGDTNVLGRYSDKLFTTNNFERVNLNINTFDVNGQKLSMTSNEVKQDWWQRLWWLKTVDTTVYDDISCIESFNYEDINKETLSQDYYIHNNDINAFKTYANASELAEKTVYFLRYRVSEYSSKNMYVCSSTNPAEMKDSISYFAEMECDLNFHVIDLTFTDENNVSTVFAVLNAPKDHFQGYDPPINVGGNDCKNMDWTKLLSLVALALILIVLAPILPYIIKGLIFVVALPFKGAKTVYKGVKRVKNKKKDNK